MTNDAPKIAVVIVAAGRGERAWEAAGGPKQYTLLKGRPLLRHTIEALQSALPSSTIFQIVIHKDDQNLYNGSVEQITGLKTAVLGGETRQQSVLEGLKALQADAPDYVFIHDAARPFIASQTIHNLLAELKNGAIACLPIAPIADTVKKVSAQRVTKTLNRDKLGLAQTPQAFAFENILKMHEQAKTENINCTDDVALAEHFNVPVIAIEGDPSNFKITTAQDIEKARDKMAQTPDIRMGTAYDVHAAQPGQSVTLCGIDIASPISLIGHSDADVALHALTDAILGALADGDIGHHFPPTDPKWKGAASEKFIRFAAERVAERGGRINMLDLTIICEEPKIGPHRDAMRQKIAEFCDLPIERVAVKATTNEKIGFLGRGEGIAAIASATLDLSGQ